MNDRTAGLEYGTLLRYALSVATGLCATLALFLLMERLIESDRPAYSEHAVGALLSFVRLPEEPLVVETKERWQPPQVVPQPVIEPLQPTPGTVCEENDCTGGVGISPPPTEEPRVMRSPLASDGEYLPIVKVAPVYPRRAASRGIQGYVLLEFTVTTLGSVRDPVVVKSSPPGVFDQAATDAALMFKYKPRVLNGQAMEVRGVRNLVRFELEHG